MAMEIHLGCPGFISDPRLWALLVPLGILSGQRP